MSSLLTRMVLSARRQSPAIRPVLASRYSRSGSTSADSAGRTTLENVVEVGPMSDGRASWTHASAAPRYAMSDHPVHSPGHVTGVGSEASDSLSRVQPRGTQSESFSERRRSSDLAARDTYSDLDRPAIRNRPQDPKPQLASDTPVGGPSAPAAQTRIARHPDNSLTSRKLPEPLPQRANKTSSQQANVTAVRAPRRTPSGEQSGATRPRNVTIAIGHIEVRTAPAPARNPGFEPRVSLSEFLQGRTDSRS
jgi:hypothetical protein